MQQRKIPTILGLVLVLVVIFLFRFAFERISPYLSKATQTATPHDVVFTNITDTTFTVTWLTDTDATGAITIDGLKEKGSVFDERDTFGTDAQTKLPGKYRTHSIAVRDLTPDTAYGVRILSDGAQHLENGKPYEVRTGPTLAGGSGAEPAYGRVSYPSGQPAVGAIVYLRPEGGQTMSSLVTPAGSWVIPMNLVRAADGTKLLEFGERLNESIVIRSSEGDAAAQTDTVNDNPVPDMTIGKTYDFKKIQAEAQSARQLAAAPTPQPTAQPIVLGTTAAPTNKVAITKPANGSAITSTLPLVQGTGIPGATVLIMLGISNPVSGTVTVGNDGIWYYTPAKPLQEGKQSVTITTKDAAQKTVAITHSFEILKSGTQVLGDATPSATLTPTPVLEDTPESTPTPTATLAGEPVPVTGFPLPLIVLMGIGVTVMLSGAVLLIL